MATFDKFLSTERRRLKKLMAAGQKKLDGMTRELVALKRHLEALTVFERTRKGKETRSRRRKRRGPKRTTLLAALKNSASSMSRKDILAKLNVKGNKSAEQSVTNALSYLKKVGKVKSKNGQYTST